LEIMPNDLESLNKLCGYQNNDVFGLSRLNQNDSLSQIVKKSAGYCKRAVEAHPEDFKALYNYAMSVNKVRHLGDFLWNLTFSIIRESLWNTCKNH